MVKDISIGNKTVKMKATAGTPRLYRITFKRDIFKDLEQLKKSYDRSSEGDSDIPIEDLTIFENVAYIMAKQGDFDESGVRLYNVPNTADEWLDEFDGVFSIYEALPQILELWGDNIITMSESKKKIAK